MGSNVKQDALILVTFQCVFLVLFGFLTEYSSIFPKERYPYFQDVHVMIFIGFGFLMTFLRRYSFSALGFNFLLASLMIQWSILCCGFFHLNENYHVVIGLNNILDADVATAAVLISMGAVLGRTSYVQLVVMGFVEIAVYAANLYLNEELFKAVDVGGSVFVHTFGAYFGLGVSFMVGKKKTPIDLNSFESSRYTSDIFAMIGTIFLWIFWPSFNAATLQGPEQHRAIVNTYLALTSCCVTAFAVSLILSPNHKFDMVHVQNSTLAGGVAVGTSVNMMLHPVGAIGAGIVAGILSVTGYAKLSPWLTENCHLRDTCGVHNLHGMPGFLGGLLGAFMTSLATEQIYGKTLYEIFPALRRSDYEVGAENYPEDQQELTVLQAENSSRTIGQQAIYQLVALGVTVAIAIAAGLLTGLLIRTRPFRKNPPENYFIDDPYWEIAAPADFPPNHNCDIPMESAGK